MCGHRREYKVIPEADYQLIYYFRGAERHDELGDPQTP